MACKFPAQWITCLQIVKRWVEDMKLLRSALSASRQTDAADLGRSRPRRRIESAHELMQRFRNSSLLVLPGVGHLAFEEMPEVCNQAMRDWLLNPSQQSADHPRTSSRTLAFQDRRAQSGAA